MTTNDEVEAALTEYASAEEAHRSAMQSEIAARHKMQEAKEALRVARAAATSADD